MSPISSSVRAGWSRPKWALTTVRSVVEPLGDLAHLVQLDLVEHVVEGLFGDGICDRVVDGPARHRLVPKRLVESPRHPLRRLETLDLRRRQPGGRGQVLHRRLGPVDGAGNGVLSAPRLHQLIRQAGHVNDRMFEIEFLDSGVQVYALTFG